MAVSPDGSMVFVTGTSSQASGTVYATVACDAATGAQLWAATYQATGSTNNGAAAVAVSHDSAKVFVTGTISLPNNLSTFATVAYQS